VPDRFDLEEKIMRASWVLEDIRLFRDRLWQREEMTNDEIDNFLMSMETIYTHRFDDLEDMMCQVFQINEYATDEQKQRRDPVFEKGYPAHPKFNEQPGLSKEDKEVVDNFYKEIEENKKSKFGPDLQSTFDSKM